MKIAIFYSLLVFICSPCLADPLDGVAFDTINISADEALEDEKPGILHLKGNFMMRSENWYVTASRATVFGSPTEPDRILLQGSPARFMLLPDDQVDKEQIEATALEIEYQKINNSLSLRGDARLILGNETIHSSTIEYDITTSRYRAGGDNGVIIRVPLED